MTNYDKHYKEGIGAFMQLESFANQVWEKRGIKLICLRDYPEFLKTISSTAEHTIGLIVALLRNYKTALNAPYKERDAYMGHTLSGKTLGIVGGHGRVGFQVAKIAEAFGMDVLIYDRVRVDNKWLTSLPVLLQRSDIVSVNIFLAGNEGFFTKKMFSQMKPTAYFVNTSRSKIVQDGALLYALENNIIVGAAVDFVDDPALLEYSKTHDNLILTNHLGGCTEEDMRKTEDFITQKVKKYVNK